MSTFPSKSPNTQTKQRSSNYRFTSSLTGRHLATSNMESLPTEILLQIARICDDDTQKALRLSCKSITDVATACVFEHVYIGLFPYSLRNLEELACSRLANNVKKLTICTDSLRWVGEHEYCQIMELGCSTTCKRPGWPTRGPNQIGFAVNVYQCTHIKYSASARLGFDFMKDMQWFQKHWSAMLEGKLATRAITKFCKLEEICLSVRRTPKRGHIGAVWKAINARIRALEDSEYCPDWLGIRLDWKGGDHHFLDVKAAICVLDALGGRASQSTCKPITKLTLRAAVPSMSMENLSLQGLLAARRYQFDSPQIISAVSQLKDLHLELHDFRESLAKPSQLKSFLRACKQLRKLDFDYNMYEYRPSPWSPEKWDLLGLSSLQLPCLETLRLSLDFLTSDTLLAFMASHSEKLRSLELHHMNIWNLEQLLAQLPQTLRLDSVKLDILRSAEDWLAENKVPQVYFDTQRPFDADMRDFLLGRRAAMPPLGRNSAESE